MKALHIIALITILCTTSACEVFYDISLRNNDSHEIYYYSTFRAKSQDPDTAINFSKDELVQIKVHDWDLIWQGRRTFDEYMQKNHFNQVKVYIFHPDTLDKYSWDEIKAGYKVLQRYDLTRRDLQQLDEEYPKIPFPPDASIRNACMFPPYGTYKEE